MNETITSLLTAPTDLVRDQVQVITTAVTALIIVLIVGGRWLITALHESRARELQRYHEELARWRTLRGSEARTKVEAARRRASADSIGFQIDPPIGGASKAPSEPEPKKPPPPLFSEEQLKRGVLLAIIVVMVLGAVVLLPFAMKSAVEVFRPVSPGWATALGIALAVVLYFVREKQRLFYGVMECVAGGLAIWVIVAQPPSDERLSQVVGFAAGVYVIIRGMDNVWKGLKEAGWKREKA